MHFDHLTAALRNALVYILNNHRKHGVSLAWLDPCSSAFHFDGWRRDVLLELAARASGKARYGDHRGGAEDASGGATCDAVAVVASRTWLATTGWRRGGLLGIDESPRMPG